MFIHTDYLISRCHNKTPEAGSAKRRYLLFILLEAGKSETKVPDDSLLVRVLFLADSPLSLMAERQTESLPFLIRPPLLLDQGPALMTSFNLENERVRHSVMPNSVTPRAVACQAPLSMGFSRQKYWNV